MKIKMITLLFLVASHPSAFATGDPFAAYECCKKFLSGEQKESCGYSADRCRVIVSSIERMMEEGQREATLYPGKSKDVQVDDVSADIKRSSEGHPLSVIIKYTITAKKNWVGNYLAPSELKWTNHTRPLEKVYTENKLRLNDGRITPEPKVLIKQIPYMYSRFGLEKDKKYFVEVEFVPSFLSGYSKPYMKLPAGWIVSPCFITDATNNLKAESKLQSINNLLATKSPSYIFELDFDQYSNLEYHEHARFSKEFNLLPLGDFYKGHKDAGTPNCVPKGAMQLHPDNVKRMERP